MTDSNVTRLPMTREMQRLMCNGLLSECAPGIPPISREQWQAYSALSDAIRNRQRMQRNKDGED